MGNAPAIEEREQPEAPPAPTCQHHWLIETPRGATSKGRCKRCGEEREFRNSASDHLWEDDSSSGYKPWSGRRAAPKVYEDDDVAAAPAGGEPALVV
ncbi:MAG TPA: hypothetical protein VFT91_06740 [Dehalococcoidia bacterium]|nr:hypothetical protein [Dehalococcoidia bacterium]